MSKKILLVLFLIILALTFTTKAAKKIEFWTINLSPNYDNYFNEKIEEFEQENPEVKIIWEDINFSSINQKLRYRIASGNIPEVVNLSPQLMTSLLAEDLLFPISTLAENYGQYYYPLLWENSYYQGQHYAFPWYLSSKLMAFNQEIFKIADLDPRKIPQNREDFYQLAVKITEKTGRYALMPQLKIQHEFIEAGIPLFKNDGQQRRAAFNTQKAKKIIERYQNLVKKGVIPKDTLNSGFNIALERYKKNKLAILFTAPQFLNEIEKESKYLKDVTALSVIPTYQAGVINAALMNLVIPKGVTDKKIAAKFAKYITSFKSQAEFVEKTSVLSSAVDLSKTTKNKLEKINFKQSLNKKAQNILAKQLQRNQDLTIIDPQADELLKIMEAEFARAFSGKISAEKALNNMERKWNQILKEDQNND